MKKIIALILVLVMACACLTACGGTKGIAEGKVLETLTLEEYREFSDLFEADLYNDIDLLTCVEKRISEGGTSQASVDAQIAYVKEQI